MLAFPPYTPAISPPLGVCYLKGYVERSLPDWRVRVVDLNLEAHRRLVEALPRPAEAPPLAFDDANLRWASEVFRGRDPEAFYDRARYLHYVQVWGQIMPERLDFAGGSSRSRGRRRCANDIRDQAVLILREEPAAVGISILYTKQALPAVDLAREIKRRTGVPVILGGTVFNEGVPEVLRGRLGPVDYVVMGGGEQPLVEILSGRAENASPPGVIRVRGRSLLGTAPEHPDDLDWIGDPDFSDLDLGTYYSPEVVLPIVTSRGCYWRRCAFCSHFRSSGQTWQLRSIPAVVEELRRHVEGGVRNFYLADSVVSPARFSELADAIIAAGLPIRYYAMARFERQFDQALLARMRKSGCLYVLWGFESGCQRVLDLMDKGTRVEVAERVLRQAAAAGIRNHVFTMFGFPTETRGEFNQTLQFLRRNRRWLAVVHRTRFALEEHSLVHRHPERFGITSMKPKPTPSVFTFTTETGMSRDAVDAAFLEARPFLRSFSGHRSVAGDMKYREHMLLVYAREDE